MCGYPYCSGSSCGDTAYPAGQRTGCTDTAGCVSDGNGEIVCACSGSGSCIDSCGSGGCQAWESTYNCQYDCNSIPTISSVNDFPDPINATIQIQFSVDWNDSDAGDQIKIHVCKNDTITAAAQNCDGGTWCNSSSFTTDDPTSCNYTTQANDGGQHDFYAFVCDDDNACSSSTYGNFNVHIAPNITTTSDSPDPVNSSSDINFSVDWDDGNPDNQVKIHICKTESLTSQVCDGGSWCDSSVFTSNDPESCDYTAQATDVDSQNYYAFVCDNTSRCSSSSSGSFFVETPPGIDSVTDSPDPARSANDIEFGVGWSDENAGEQVKIHICKTDSLTNQVCDGGSWCDSSVFTADDPESCNYTIVNQDAGSNSYYSFVCDASDLCSSSTSGTFAVFVLGENLVVELTLEGTSNSVYIPGVGVVSASNLGSQTFQNPPQYYVASYLLNTLYGLVGAQGGGRSLSASNTSSNHTVSMSLGLENSKMLLIMTKGDWNTISSKMSLVEAGTFFLAPIPSFSRGLGILSTVMIMVKNTNIDILKTAIYQRGTSKLYVENINQTGGKTVVNVTR
ncbi:MAG: hypothetical protein ABIH90_00265 [Candidatus Aenigmatarchaeota archaeon]